VRVAGYVDGFNLYYGLLKGRRGVKWLDVVRLVEFFAHGRKAVFVRYFTAPVRSPPWDPGKSSRQQTYLRALVASYPGRVFVEQGIFLQYKARRPSVSTGKLIEVIESQEKGSDVNLATRLILDSFDDRFDIAIIVSNDSDLVVPVKEVRQRFGKQIWVVSPQRQVSQQLRQHADRYLQLRASHVKKCQLPDPVRTPDGRTVYKPRDW